MIKGVVKHANYCNDVIVMAEGRRMVFDEMAFWGLIGCQAQPILFKKPRPNSSKGLKALPPL